MCREIVYRKTNLSEFWYVFSFHWRILNVANLFGPICHTVYHGDLLLLCFAEHMLYGSSFICSVYTYIYSYIVKSVKVENNKYFFVHSP